VDPVKIRLSDKPPECAGHRMAPRQFDVAVSADDQEGHRTKGRDDELEEAQRRRIREVQVFDDDDDRLLRGDAGQELADGVENPEARADLRIRGFLLTGRWARRDPGYEQRDIAERIATAP
jgi:hypothetical protein